MQRAELEQEQLWSQIQARKQRESPRSNGHRNGSSNGSGTEIDALLVNMLCTTFEEDQAAAASVSGATRALLQTAIRADTASRIVRYPSKRNFWQVSGNRQLAGTLALCMVTIAALGYLIWQEWAKGIKADAVIGRPSTVAAATGRPNAASPVAPVKPGKANSKSTMQFVPPAVPVKVEMTAPHDCKTPQVK